MPRPIKIAPSILSANFARLADEIALVEAAGADWIHVDVMDGHFVPNLTIGPVVVQSIRPCTRLPLDVHLMIENPDRYIADFGRAGADILTVHLEVCPHLHRTVQAIKDEGMQAGVAINPHTPLNLLDEVLPELDLVLVMSVNPGFAAQDFIPATLDKLQRLREICHARGLATVQLEIDGGIKLDNVAGAAAAGADVLVSGSGIYGTEDPAATLKKMKSLVSGS